MKNNTHYVKFKPGTHGSHDDNINELLAVSENVANTIPLLLKPEADFINCSIIYCDGKEHQSVMV